MIIIFIYITTDNLNLAMMYQRYLEFTPSHLAPKLLVLLVDNLPLEDCAVIAACGDD